MRALALALALLPAAAHATTGGAESVSVLGLDPLDAKLYLLQTSHGEGGELPQLLYYRLADPPAEQAPDRPIRVRSWYERDFREQEEAFPGRLESLKARLQPVEEASLEGIELSLSYGGLSICSQQKLQVGDEERAAVESWLAEANRSGTQPVVPDDWSSDPVSVCREINVTIRWDGREATTTIQTWGALDLGGAWTLQDTTRRLVILRHTGVTVESGYSSDVPLLLEVPR